MYPILSDDSRTKVKTSGVQQTNQKPGMTGCLTVKTPAAGAESCNATASTDKVVELGRKLKVTGTPTIFFTDGSRVPGAIGFQGLGIALSSYQIKITPLRSHL
jgi:thiol:disulfide interchange protein DsbC